MRTTNEGIANEHKILYLELSTNGNTKVEKNTEEEKKQASRIWNKKGLHTVRCAHRLKNFVTERVTNQLKKIKTCSNFTQTKTPPPPRKKSKIAKNIFFLKQYFKNYKRTNYTTFCMKKHKVAPHITLQKRNMKHNSHISLESHGMLWDYISNIWIEILKV